MTFPVGTFPVESLVHVLSYLPPTDYLEMLMGPQFDEVLAAVQGYALLPTRTSAIDFLYKAHEEELRGVLKAVKESYLSDLDTDGLLPERVESGSTRP